MGDYITYDQLMRRWEARGKELRTLKVENATLLEALRNLCNMVERYKSTELSQEPLVQYFHALDAIQQAKEK